MRRPCLTTLLQGRVVQFSAHVERCLQFSSLLAIRIKTIFERSSWHLRSYAQGVSLVHIEQSLPAAPGTYRRFSPSRPLAAKTRGVLVYIRLVFASSQDLQASHRLFRVVGLVRDARYGGIREGARPVAYVPFAGVRSDGTSVPQNWGTFIMRTSSANPLAMAEALRREVSRARPEFRVSRVRTQLEINQAQTVRERLLALLALFFGVVAPVLGGVGLYGVLHYSALERQREIGIRMAIGAPVAAVVRIVTVGAFLMALVGAAMGLGARSVHGGAVLRS